MKLNKKETRWGLQVKILLKLIYVLPDSKPFLMLCQLTGLVSSNNYGAACLSLVSFSFLKIIFVFLLSILHPKIDSFLLYDSLRKFSQVNWPMMIYVKTQVMPALLFQLSFFILNGHKYMASFCDTVEQSKYVLTNSFIK